MDARIPWDAGFFRLAADVFHPAFDDQVTFGVAGHSALDAHHVAGLVHEGGANVLAFEGFLGEAVFFPAETGPLPVDEPACGIFRCGISHLQRYYRIGASRATVLLPATGGSAPATWRTLLLALPRIPAGDGRGTKSGRERSDLPMQANRHNLPPTGISCHSPKLGSMQWRVFRIYVCCFFDDAPRLSEPLR